MDAVIAKCPSCSAAVESEREIWKCLWCPDKVCTRCYTDHTFAHEAIHSPAIHKKRKTQKCRAEQRDGTEFICDRNWGHEGDHSMTAPAPAFLFTWPRAGD